MRNFKRILLIITVISLLMPIVAYGKTQNNKLEAADIKGVFINTAYNLDFPTRKNMSAKELRNEIENTVMFLKNSGYNTLYFEAYTGGEGMYKSSKMPFSRFLSVKNKFLFTPDPLALFTEIAKKENMAVYATIDPFYISKEKEIINENSFAYQNPSNTTVEDGLVFLNPTKKEVQDYIVDISHELARKYDIEGVVFTGLDSNALILDPDYYENIYKIITMSSDRIKAVDNKKVGVVLNKSNNTKSLSVQIATKLAQNHAIDFIMPKIFSSATTDNYLNEVKYWQSLSTDIGVRLVTINLASKIKRPTNDKDMFYSEFEMNYQYIINKNSYISGFCIDSLWPLADKTLGINSRLSGLLKSSSPPLSEKYEISTALGINTDTQFISTEGDSYYITGTSDPKTPLYVNDTLVTDRTPLGVFGIDLELTKTNNRFIFKQGKERKIITITNKKEEAEVKTVRISQIEEDSIFPKTTTPILYGDKIKLSCIAPGGSVVTATVGGMSVNLIQDKKVVINTPVLYQGEIDLKDINKNIEVEDLGKVSYALSNKNKISVYRSKGSLAVFGKGYNPVIIVDDYFAGVRSEPTPNSSFLYTLKKGARDYILGEQGDYYLISSGGYIAKTSVEIDVSSISADSAFTSYYSESDGSSEVYLIKGTSSPPIKAALTDKNLTLTFYNTTQLPQFIPSKDSVFSDILKTKGEDENTFKLIFVLKQQDVFWGYDINYTGVDGKDTIIYIKHKPKLSLGATQPLKGVSILLDPGHGGTDIGAIGAAGKGGPIEAQLNLTLANTTKKVLEEMGATVQLTRFDDTNKTLFDRIRIGQQMKSDFFISLHHNSLPYGTNAENIKGTEVYYHYPQFEQFSKSLANNISKGANLIKRGAIESDFLVTRTTSCPSVLLEVGYIANPYEYGELLEPMNMYRVSAGIADTIIESLM